MRWETPAWDVFVCMSCEIGKDGEQIRLLNVEKECNLSTCCGHGLVVERVLAKDETGFRLPLAAQ